MSISKTLVQNGIDYIFNIDIPDSDDATIQIEAAPKPGAPDSSIVRIRVHNLSGKPLPDGTLSLHWELPVVDMHGMLYFPPSPEDMNRLPFWTGQMGSCANSSLPFFMLFHRSSHNRFAFGMANQIPETKFNYEMSELTASYTFTFQCPIAAGMDGAWEESFYLSRADRPWPEIVRDYTGFVDAAWPQERLKVSAEAFEPVFCTWTAIHHAVDQEWVLNNARLAAGLGFKTWITDDGWFTEKASFADYRYSGDWQPSLKKFPDFAGHVRQVQAMGFKYLLWVAPFMVGQESAAARTYAHLLQKPIDRLHFANLTPWKQETGQVIASLLEERMNAYNLDGFKLDFIDAVRPEEKPADADFRTAGEGVYSILSEAVDRLSRIKPGVLIEFRNSYTNLASRRYANLYRASDVPVNFSLNRWQVAMERLLTPDRAVVLDPALWHPQDTDDNVAVALINTIVSVPMVSVDLQKYPQTHLDLIRYWIGFYREHLDTIVHGEFRPEFLRGFLPVIRFSSLQERIIGVYEDYPIRIEEGPSPLWILNASSRPYIDTLPDAFSGSHQVIARDKFGRITSQAVLQFPTARLSVEVGGSLELKEL